MVTRNRSEVLVFETSAEALAALERFSISPIPRRSALWLPHRRLRLSMRCEHAAEPLSVGRGIIATGKPNKATVLECIRDLGLEWQIIFNKGAVMVLPPGVNKATGLAAALDALELSPLNVLAIGDAENDLPSWPPAAAP